MAFYLLLWSLFVLQIGAQGNETVNIIGTKDIPVTQQTYNWNPEYRCRLLAHGSVILQNDDHYLLVFDSGMAKYKFNWNGTADEILDLNGWTVTVDLSKRFGTQDFGVVSQTKKAVNVPVLNRFGMWADSTQNSVYIQGGHFYEAPGWDESQYHVNTSNIPPYNIWKYDLSSREWSDVTELGNKKDKFQRALGGAGLSVPSLNQSFYVGGIVSSRSDPTAPVDLFTPLGGMLVYDHDNDNLFNETYGSDDEQGFGFWHGSLNHMALGAGKGFLISLMGEKGIVGVTRPDAPGVNDETGMPVAFNYVLFYDLDKNQWYKQQTTFIDGDEPITRTRFCGQTVYSNTTNTWELWIYGGQLVDDKGTGVDDIYVLSMPSFIWTKVKVAQGENHIRTHTCHAIGSQLLVVGGYPPGFTVEPDVPCANELIRVLDMNTISWKSYYDPGTVYSTPQDIIDHVELGSGERRDPYLKPWADPALETAFNYVPPASSNSTVSSKPTKRDPPFASWKIAVIVVGALIALALIVGIRCLVVRRRQDDERTINHQGISELPDNIK